MESAKANMGWFKEKKQAKSLASAKELSKRARKTVRTTDT
jgi:hypothetical protein